MASVPFWFRMPSNSLWLDKSSAINCVISLFSRLNEVSIGLGLRPAKFSEWIDKIKEIFSDPALDDSMRQERLVFLISECNFRLDKTYGECYKMIEKKLIDLG